MRIRSIIYLVLTVLLLAPLSAVAVTWSSNWTTGFSGNAAAQTQFESISAPNTAMNGTAIVDMGVFADTGNIDRSLTATLSRSFTTSGTNPANSVDFFVDYVFASTFTRTAGNFEINFVSGTAPTVMLGPIGGTAGDSTLTASLQEMTSYTMTIVVEYETTQNGNKQWNNHTAPDRSPYNFTFSGG